MFPNCPLFGGSTLQDSTSNIVTTNQRMIATIAGDDSFSIAPSLFLYPRQMSTSKSGLQKEQNMKITQQKSLQDTAGL